MADEKQDAVRSRVEWLPLDAPYCPNPTSAPWVAGSADRTERAMILRIWAAGQPQEVLCDGGAVCVDAVAPDGRTVQLVFYDRGAVLLRGWAAGDLHEQGGDNRTAFSWSPSLHPQTAPRPDASSSEAPSIFGSL